MILLHLSKFANYSTELLWIFGFIAIAVQILDYIVPAWGTKKFGGTKYGTWGSIIGLLIGIFVLPSIIVLGPFGLFGIILGPFFGALVGEKIGGMGSDKALKAAFGSFSHGRSQRWTSTGPRGADRPVCPATGEEHREEPA